MAEVSCVVGTVVREVYATMPDIRAACDASITGHAMNLTEDIRLAMEDRQVSGFLPESLALRSQAVLQGAFILAKARGATEIAADSIDHLIRYIRLLFASDQPRRTV